MLGKNRGYDEQMKSGYETGEFDPPDGSRLEGGRHPRIPAAVPDHRKIDAAHPTGTRRAGDRVLYHGPKHRDLYWSQLKDAVISRKIIDRNPESTTILLKISTGVLPEKTVKIFLITRSRDQAAADFSRLRSSKKMPIPSNSSTAICAKLVNWRPLPNDAGSKRNSMVYADPPVHSYRVTHRLTFT